MGNGKSEREKDKKCATGCERPITHPKTSLCLLITQKEATCKKKGN